MKASLIAFVSLFVTGIAILSPSASSELSPVHASAYNTKQQSLIRKLFPLDISDLRITVRYKSGEYFVCSYTLKEGTTCTLKDKSIFSNWKSCTFDLESVQGTQAHSKCRNPNNEEISVPIRAYREQRLELGPFSAAELKFPRQRSIEAGPYVTKGGYRFSFPATMFSDNTVEIDMLSRVIKDSQSH